MVASSTAAAISIVVLLVDATTAASLAAIVVVVEVLVVLYQNAKWCEIDTRGGGWTLVHLLFRFLRLFGILLWILD